MIRHLALFNFKPEVGDAEQASLLDRIRRFQDIPTVKSLSIGKLLEPRESWYVPRMSADYAWLLLIDFEDETGLYTFQTDTYHLEIAQEIRNRATMVRVMDFVIR